MGGKELEISSQEQQRCLPSLAVFSSVLAQPLPQACCQITMQGPDGRQLELPVGLTGMLILPTDKW